MAASSALSFNSRAGRPPVILLPHFHRARSLTRLRRVVALHARGAERVDLSGKLAGVAAILATAICLPLYARPHVSPSSTAQEQTHTATVHGAVTDPSGAIIPGASVEFLWDKKYTVQTNADGMYKIQLEPGTYDVQAHGLGFRTAHKERLLLDPGAQVDLN